jgi:hypothetical protein
MGQRARGGWSFMAAFALACGAAASLECGGRPEATQPAATPEPPAAVASADAVAVPVRAFHVLTIAQCSREAAECSLAHATAPPGPTYVVAAGAGGGSTRSREQAMADLYRELRDGTAYGSHLVARPRHLDESEGGAPGADEKGAKTAKPGAGDPLDEAAIELMGLVDSEGEITIDRAPSNASCKVALAARERLDASAGVERCFLAEERHEGGKGHGRGIPW